MNDLSEAVTATDTSSRPTTKVAHKVRRRLVWFLALLFITSYLDRINMSFAALTLNKDLGLSATQFGLANSVFYVAYVIAEIPSNMLMPRFGARLWIPRIMITWGLASAATMFATGAGSLYVLRGLTGLAEAGFMPGVLLYLTYWLPASHRARATSLFIMAQPITILFGSSLSGLMLEMNGWLGLKGWQWLFLLQGAPAVVLGVVALFYLENKPADAKWLSADEKADLQNAITREDLSAPSSNPGDGFHALFSWPILLLSLTYLGMVVSLITNSTWTPQIVRAVAPHRSLVVVGLIAAIPALATLIVMPLWGARSDARKERRWHVAIPMLAAAMGWLLVAWAGDPVVRLLGLILCVAGAFSAQGIFWTLPASFLAPAARPVGIAMINTIGMLGTTIGPLVIGLLKDRTGSFTSGLMFVAAAVAIGALSVLSVRTRNSANRLSGPQGIA